MPAGDSLVPQLVGAAKSDGQTILSIHKADSECQIG
jgi:hypothetical protein